MILNLFFLIFLKKFFKPYRHSKVNEIFTLTWLTNSVSLTQGPFCCIHFTAVFISRTPVTNSYRQVGFGSRNLFSNGSGAAKAEIKGSGRLVSWEASLGHGEGLLLPVSAHLSLCPDPLASAGHRPLCLDFNIITTLARLSGTCL